MSSPLYSSGSSADHGAVGGSPYGTVTMATEPGSGGGGSAGGAGGSQITINVGKVRKAFLLF